MTDRDQFVMQQVTPQLTPGEQILHMGAVLKAPSLLFQILFAGLITFILTKAYYAAVTSKGRMIMIRTTMGAFGGFKMVNRGVEVYPLLAAQRALTGGLFANKSITFWDAQNQKFAIRMNPMSGMMSGQKTFFQEVPKLVNERRLISAAG
jgi:hypothetical protein